ncbi:restriction endonuclease subunit S [Vibrio parahaemolyticus]|uniref:restriction endonuclease subunit S n=1 Tax=Vibrio parahaemolyticus TaxID=670 RepID=UPI00081BF0FC|nr:restriction endonuclease subunit S [Vibrio parahaemolyticus]MBE3755976.1 restriction endonuclease subunit S [Vibrio parahaemolyticus]MBO0153268.1 restriction endonuclease subunit S [Vibrio parahaemolyticus]MBO0183982.1 restriction endonuclease subunit S [Vibrio parahaemolyticus]MDF4344616.1 restriction endonuclease subunit S [Vibrio parahaemolyticus]MDF4358410.1 restriction endonuclease subunit S [Vibrio parahaemolyticus]
MALENLITEHIDIWTSAEKTRSTSGRGSSKKLELYGVKKLRELILDLAVRGKLVPQDPNDEPASVLLERIAQEKDQLVKEKKIKKPKPLPKILTDEVNFSLPPSWQWTHFSNILDFSGGGQPPKSYFSEEKKEGFVQLIQIRDLGPNPQPVYIPREKASKFCTENDVMVGRYGASVGKVFWGKDGAYNVALIKIHNDFNAYTPNFIHLLLRSPLGQSLFGGISRSAQDGFSKKDIEHKLIPYLSIAEQRRIVAKVDELMALCDQLEQQTEASIEAHQVLVTTLLDTLTNSVDADELMQNWTRISEHFDTLFTTEESIDQLKQTILQLAVMGKLVPQDPSDEPAAELLKRIAEEKAQLVKEKKIKKEKALPPIAEDEKPFELPNGWEWCRLEDVVDIQSGITKGRKLAGRELKTIPYLSVANVQRGYLILNNVKEIDLPIDELEKYSVEDGDLLITEGGDWDKVGRTAIWRSEVPYMAHQNHVFKARPFLKEQSEAWLEMYLNGPFARKYFAGSSKQTTNLASINKTQLRSCLIAVPPRDEKKEISDRVQELIGMCDLLLEGIRASLQTQLQLTDVIVDQAV